MFSLRHFIRRASAASLQTYVASRQIPNSAIAWEDDRREWLEPLIEFVEQLPRPLIEHVHADFEEVNQLCDEIGQRALRAMFAGDLEIFDTLDGAEARGLHVLVSDPEGFRHAQSIAYSERLYHGRSWSRYYVSKPTEPASSTEVKAAFVADLRDLFGRADNSAGRISVESFERPTTGVPTYMVSVFVEALPESMIEFSGDVPQRTTRRPVVEAALSYDPSNGIIDIVAKGGKAVRDEIGEAFVHHLLGSETELLPVSARTFDLERLRRPLPFSTDPEDGIKDVSLTALRLRDLADPSSRIALETAPGGDGLHALAQRWFGDGNPLVRDTWRIEQARLVIQFHPGTGVGRPKRVTVELRAPNGSNLKEQIRRHEIISSKYLARWHLVDAERS